MTWRKLLTAFGFLAGAGLIAIGLYMRMRDHAPEPLSAAFDSGYGVVMIAIGVLVVLVLGAYTVSRK